MGKALYRKYRSKSFDQVIGQEHITDTLKNALKKGAISHAYLFTGPRGVGKTSIARILAHAINDIGYQDESIHLDIIEIDAASNRRIDEIRDLRDKVHIAPTSAKYKVYIIDEVHMLTREAFNALLKTLEEPPEHVVFILATTEAHKVPDTIISRTQRFSFKPISEQATVTHLKSIAEKEGFTITEEALKLLSTHGNGSFRDSISMLDQLSGMTKKIEKTHVEQLLGIPTAHLLENVITALKQQEVKAILKSLDDLRDQGIDSGKAAASLSQELRSILVEGTSGLSQKRIIELLHNLLPLTLSSSDYIGLEIALLRGLVHETTSVASQEPTKPKETPVAPATPKKAPKIKEKSEPEAISPTVELPPAEKKQPLNASSFSTDVWLELLNELKKTHNTLYGVLRMAQPNMEGSTLTLGFNFGFHKKQVDSPKNTAVIREFARNYFAATDIVTKVSKNSAAQSDSPSTTSPQNSDNNDAISSVSNIFGGAELLES